MDRRYYLYLDRGTLGLPSSSHRFFSRKPVGWAIPLSPNTELVKKPLTIAYESRGSYVSLGSGMPVHQRGIPAATLELSDETEPQSSWQLLRYAVYYAYEHRIGLTRAEIGVIAFALTCRPIQVFPEYYRAQRL